MNDPKSNVTGVLMKKKDSMIETRGKDAMGPEKQRWRRGLSSQGTPGLPSTPEAGDPQSAQRS